MARGLSSAFKTELATKNINPVLLLNVNFSTPIYYTNAPFDIAYDGNTYTITQYGHIYKFTDPSTAAQSNCIGTTGYQIATNSYARIKFRSS